MIAYACDQAKSVIAVSEPLQEKLIDLGIPREKIPVIPNGIDCDIFRPLDAKEQCRARLSLPIDKQLVVYVGNLEQIKGIDILIEAAKEILKKSPHQCLSLHLPNNLEDLFVSEMFLCPLLTPLFFCLCHQII